VPGKEEMFQNFVICTSLKSDNPKSHNLVTTENLKTIFFFLPTRTTLNNKLLLVLVDQVTVVRSESTAVVISYQDISSKRTELHSCMYFSG